VGQKAVQVAGDAMHAAEFRVEDDDQAASPMG
jgi:hypothetical protein